MQKVTRLPPVTPNPVDVHVGGRLRLRRTLMGVSQEKLGDSVGLTFQQIQKYERGSNRIGCSRAYEFSQVLGVPVSFFFDDMPEELKTHEGRFEAGVRDKDQPDTNPMATRENLELVRSCMSIVSPPLKKAIYSMVKAAGKYEGDGHE